MPGASVESTKLASNPTPNFGRRAIYTPETRHRAMVPRFVLPLFTVLDCTFRYNIRSRIEEIFGIWPRVRSLSETGRGERFWLPKWSLQIHHGRGGPVCLSAIH